MVPSPPEVWTLDCTLPRPPPIKVVTAVKLPQTADKTAANKPRLSEEQLRIVEARHHDPFSVLGRQPDGDDTLVRAFLPRTGWSRAVLETGVSPDPAWLDARVVVDQTMTSRTVRPYSHLAIRPYPEEYVRSARLRDGTPVLLRPCRRPVPAIRPSR
mgnify:CR=1 FL=1